MTHTYQITGMSCDGCRTKVEKTLNDIADISKVTVTLSPPEAVIECPMHPEIEENAPGSCPICGMDLVPKEVTLEGEDTTYKDLMRKFKIAAAFTLPIFVIAMSEMIPNNPLYRWLPQNVWNWLQFGLSLPVVFYATWMFFQRAWASVRRWNLNMFTLIGLGAGAAFVFSVVAMLFPDIFPDQFILLIP